METFALNPILMRDTATVTVKFCDNTLRTDVLHGPRMDKKD